MPQNWGTKFHKSVLLNFRTQVNIINLGLHFLRKTGHLNIGPSQTGSICWQGSIYWQRSTKRLSTNAEGSKYGGLRGTHSLLMELQTCATTIKINVEILRKLKINLPYDPATLPYTHNMPEESASCSTETCTSMFIAALLTVATQWTQPKYPKAEEWIIKMWCIVLWDIVQL